MEFLSGVHLSCFVLTYLVALVTEVYQFLRRRTKWTRSVLVTSAAAGLVAHTAYLVTRSGSSGLPPLVGSSHDWLLVLAWLVAVLYLILVATNQRAGIGLFVLPLTITLIVLALLVDKVPDASHHHIAFRRWGMLHAASLVIGMGTVAASTLCAVMYLVQYQKLRGRTSWLHRLQLPSLEQLTSLNKLLVVSSVAMLTIGLITGFILAVFRRQTAEPFQWSDPLVGGTGFVWLVMVVAVARLLTHREQSGRQVAQLTLMAGGFLLLTIFGLMLLSGGIHESAGAAVFSWPTESAARAIMFGEGTFDR